MIWNVYGLDSLVLGLPWILLMEEVVHTLIEFAKRKNYFIMEFINIVKLAKVELY
jgi:hypothetical protein